MGWKQEGYYQRHVKLDNGNSYSYKLTSIQDEFNKLKPNQVREAISIVQSQYMKDTKSIDSDIEVEQVKLPKGEKIEYVIGDAIGDER